VRLNEKRKARIAPGLCDFPGPKIGTWGTQVRRAELRCLDGRVLLGGHFFGFALLAHEFEFALGGFELGVDFLLDAGCRLFELR
jgi:hypothetical protein